MSLHSVYPTTAPERTEWILARRAPRHQVDAAKPYAFFAEEERSERGELTPTATIFLTNRECPWKCVFCDLWRNTLAEPTPAGAIPAQIDHALARLPPARQVKLYNSGSFFDRHAVPPGDHPAIAARVRLFERVIVESHPALVNEGVPRFRDLLGGALEVAMGLETTHPGALEKLNKGMTIDGFARATAFLKGHDIALRVFLLVNPPFVPRPEAPAWARRALDFAFDCGASVCSLIPTRGGNGSLEALAAAGEFAQPALAELEAALSYGIGLRRGRVFADLWDLQRFSACDFCYPKRLERLRRMNHTQSNLEPVVCACQTSR